MVAVLSASGPHASLEPEARIWDRFVGAWDCDFGFYLENGGVRHSPGELEFGWVLDGRAIQDLWITYPAKGETERGIGTSIRFFDGKSRTWRVVFVNPKYSALLTVQGGVEGDRIVLRGRDNDGSLIRWSFNDIRDDSFTWRGEKSRDEGKTWILEEEHHMRRRPAGRGDNDMIRVLSASGPHVGLGSMALLFDRFVGIWDLDCELIAADGETTRFHGAWVFGWVVDGRVIQDVLIDGEIVAGKRRGTTLRFYEAHSGQWHVVWIPPESGNVITLRGGAAGDRIVLVGKDVDGADLRWSFNDIQPDSFLWRGEISRDGGQTWRTEQVMRVQRRRPGPGASSRGPASDRP